MTAKRGSGALPDPHRNGTGIAMPRQTVTIRLDALGYTGWFVTMHINPRGSVYDELVSGEAERWWKAMGQITIEWNFADEQGRAMPHPSEVESEKALDLPVLLLSHILDEYVAAVRSAATLKKAPSDKSEPIKSTSGESPS